MERDIQAAKRGGQIIDRFVRKLAHADLVDQRLESDKDRRITRDFKQYDLRRQNTRKLQKGLVRQGFATIMHDDTMNVLSKEVQIGGVKHVAQVTFKANTLVCKCYVGTLSPLNNKETK